MTYQNILIDLEEQLGRKRKLEDIEYLSNAINKISNDLMHMSSINKPSSTTPKVKLITESLTEEWLDFLDQAVYSQDNISSIILDKDDIDKNRIIEGQDFITKISFDDNVKV